MIEWTNQNKKITNTTNLNIIYSVSITINKPVGDQWAKIQGAIGASSNVFGLIRRVPSIRDPQGDNSPNESERQTNGKEDAIIEISDMTVTYGAMDTPALENINLKVREGDRVAIVGRSGSVSFLFLFLY